jgi:hypothetical protein
MRDPSMAVAASRVEPAGTDDDDDDAWAPLVALAGARAELVDRLLGTPWRGPGPARSILDNDGVPLQLCVSTGPAHRAVRLIGDPWTAVLDPAERAAASVASAAAVVRAAGAASLVPFVDTTIAHALPTGAERAALRHGAVWLAAAVDGTPGAAVYTTLEWERRAARWSRVHAWLDAILPIGMHAQRRLAALRDVATPVSAAIEGRAPADARAKVYVRLVEPRRLAELGVDELAAPAIVDFVAAATGGATLPSTGLVISLGFSLGTGELADVKADVCGHCVARPPAKWARWLSERTAALGVRPFDVDLGADPALDVAFVGVGRSVAGEPRCNLYVRARRRR